MSFDAAATPTATTVSVENLSKAYLLWDNPRDRLWQPLRNRLGRVLRIAPHQYYRQFWALHDLSFGVARGETLGVIGRNGSGKSTLLQLLAGTLTPTSGGCTVNGRVSALLELGSGFNPEFTGRENVYVNAAILGLSAKETEERLPAIEQFAGIGEYIDQPVKLYSSGMFMRLAFAVAINVEPDVLIVDEALAVGDAFFVQKCMRFMRRFKEEHTLLFVSHDTLAVTNICDRALLLDQGRMVALGPARDVCRMYMEHQFASRQEIDKVEQLSDPRAYLPDTDDRETEAIDQRLKYINRSPLRNDIQIFSFDPASDRFGAGGARLVDVRLLDGAAGRPVAWAVGGEVVALEVYAVAEKPLIGPILGFMVKDRLGQVVFSDNTYLTYAEAGLEIDEGETFRARFEFRMPILPAGDYAVAASIAVGTQLEHVQLHWLHEAMIFRSETSSVCTGLVGVPMRSIDIRIVEGRSE